MNYKDTNLPNYSQIINFEKMSIKNGSGISNEELLGKWNLKNVWKKGSSQIDNISSSILQILEARLELIKYDSAHINSNLKIRNSIKFGIISVEFFGFAFLKGQRPLLFFTFEKLVFKIGSLIIFNKDLEISDTNKMPFFSLIRMDENFNWLCARGKGGGLAMWIRN